MLPALGKPLAARVIDRLYSAGIRRYVVVVGEDEGGVAAYLNNHPLPNATVDFTVLSNADSLNHVLLEIADRCQPPFLATSYNSFAHQHFAERLLKQGAQFHDALVLSGGEAPVEIAEDRFIGYANGDRLLEISARASQGNAQGLVLTDMALCGSEFIDYIKQSPPRRSLIELFQDYLAEGHLTHIVHSGWALQIYSDDDLQTLNRHLLEEEEDVSILSEIPLSVQIIPPVHIDPQVSVGPEARIGPYVYLESGSSVGHHAVLRHALVLQRAIVPPHVVVADRIVSSRSHILT
jgi:NDP-sugar pyrophosphorylase family protein